MKINWATVARDAAGLIGAACVAIGVGLIYVPAGVIVAGAMLVGAAFLTARKSSFDSYMARRRGS